MSLFDPETVREEEFKGWLVVCAIVKYRYVLRMTVDTTPTESVKNEEKDISSESANLAPFPCTKRNLPTTSLVNEFRSRSTVSFQFSRCLACFAATSIFRQLTFLSNLVAKRLWIETHKKSVVQVLALWRIFALKVQLKLIT